MPSGHVRRAARPGPVPRPAAVDKRLRPHTVQKKVLGLTTSTPQERRGYISRWMLFRRRPHTFGIMPSTRLSVRSVLPLIITTGFAVLLLSVPVSGSLSVLGTRWLLSATSGVPGIELISDAGLMLLAAITAVTLGRAWWTHPDRRPQIVMAAVGVVLAYLLSEGGKLVFAQERPCSVWAIATECPPPGDWSLPSNHATLAFGAAAAIALTVGRSWLTWSAMVLAAVVAVGRVAEGVHYLHDIALGAVLGVTVPIVLVALAERIRRTHRTGSPVHHE